MKVGDRVRKFTGDYQLDGVIVAIFDTTAGKTRVVVEHKQGFLHIYNPMQLKVLHEA